MLEPGEALDRVRKKTTELSLIAKAAGMEVMEQTIRADSLFGLSPAREGVAEFLYILSGDCVLQGADGSEVRRLGPGTSVTSAELKSNAYFKSLSELRLLYVSTQPVFSYLSEQIGELVEMARQVEEKDNYTAMHCERLQKYATLTGERLGLPPHRMEHLIYAALLHDVGKTGVPVTILGKPGPLTEAEMAEMRKHPVVGAQLVAETYLKDVARIVAQHHERFDGSGYPLGLVGSQITLEACIVACVDAYDAMTSNRPYRGALPVSEAVAELRRNRGRQFHPRVVDALVKILVDEGLNVSSKALRRRHPASG